MRAVGAAGVTAVLTMAGPTTPCGAGSKGGRLLRVCRQERAPCCHHDGRQADRQARQAG